MKRFLALILAMVMVLTLAACGKSSGSSASTPAAAASSSAAPSEAAAPANIKADDSYTGNVMIYTSMYKEVVALMTDALAKKFPNAHIEFFQGGTGDIQTKVTGEMESGKLGCDMMMVAEPAYSLELKEAGYLHAYKSEAAKNLRFDYDADGYWYPVRVCSMVLAYNPEMYKKEEVATSFKDFAYNTSLKGSISMSNPLTSGTAMATVCGLTDTDKFGGYGYFDALKAQDIQIESGSSALAKLETGECKEVMILEESVLKKKQEDSSYPIEVIYPDDGNFLIPSTIMTVAEEHSANKNIGLCEAITDWFLSKEGQSYIVSAWMHSVLKDYPDEPFAGAKTADLIASDIGVDWNRCYKQREEIRTEWQNRVLGG